MKKSLLFLCAGLIFLLAHRGSSASPNGAYCAWREDVFLLSSERKSPEFGTFEVEGQSIQWKGRRGKGIIEFTAIKNYSYSIDTEADLGTLTLKLGLWNEIKLSDVSPRCFSEFMQAVRKSKTHRQ